MYIWLVAYSRDAIVRSVLRELERVPTQTRVDIARLLKIDRHTLTRALAEAGTSFSSLRELILKRRLTSLEQQGAVLSSKELAAALGFGSVRAMQKWRATGLRAATELDHCE